MIANWDRLYHLSTRLLGKQIFGEVENGVALVGSITEPLQIKEIYSMKTKLKYLIL